MPLLKMMGKSTQLALHLLNVSSQSAVRLAALLVEGTHIYIS